MTDDARELFKGTFLEFLGFKLIAWKDGFVRLEMPVRPEHKNTIGYVHGGVISSLLDISGALSGNHGRSKEYVSVTINMNTTYLSPLRSRRVVAEGELIRRTKSMFFSQMKVLDPENNRLCATATGVYKPQARNTPEAAGAGTE